MKHQRRHLMGFTLMEVMITVAIVSILAAVAIPNYSRAVEQGRWSAARDVLRTIYAGEQVFFTVNNNAYLDNPTTLAQWRQIYTDDPNGNSSIPVTFSINASGGPCPCPPAVMTFTAIARLNGTAKQMTIDDTNTLDTSAWPKP